MLGRRTIQLEADEWALLESIPLVCGLPDTLVSRLAKEQVPLRLEKGTVLFQQGQTETDVHVVLSGWIKLFRTGETGTETIIRIAGAGDVLGEADLLLGEGRQTCAETITHARVLSLDGQKLASQMRRDPVLGLRMAASLSVQVQYLTKHLENIKLFDAPQRTARFLLDLCPEQTGACSISLPYEKAVIAEWLGMKPASFSRALARLRGFGVTVDRESILISDTKRLVDLTHTSTDEKFQGC